MSAQRVGALPPYNELLGGKMVALTLSSNELRNEYCEKYKNYTSLIKGRKIEPTLLFITTTSAFGRSSIYNRLKFNDVNIAKSLGFTKGSGTFHISEHLYEEILTFLSSMGVDVARKYGHGPSRKMRLINLGLKRLGLANFEYHGIKREFFLFPLITNLNEAIQQNDPPNWLDHPFQKLVTYWKDRWALPRAQRNESWRMFVADKYLNKVSKELRAL